MSKWKNQDEGIFYAGDVFNRDGLSYCCATADSAISNDATAYTITTSATSKGLTDLCCTDSAITVKADSGWSNAVTFDDVSALNVNVDSLSSRIDALENICGLSNSEGIVARFFKSPYKWHKFDYKTLRDGREMDSRSRET